MGLRAPTWVQKAVATEKGWEHPTTGELYVALRNLKTRLEEKGLPTSKGVDAETKVKVKAETPVAKAETAATVETTQTEETVDVSEVEDTVESVEDNVEDVETEVKKDVKSLSKKALEAYALETHGFDLDRRRKVDFLRDQVVALEQGKSHDEVRAMEDE